MLRAPVLVLLVLTAATAAQAENGPRQGPSRWLLEPRDAWMLDAAPPAADPITRLIEHCKRNPIGVRPLVTLLPPDPEDGRSSALPTIAFFARAQGRTLVSLTRFQVRADVGQEVVMQRTLVSDLLAGQRFSLTVYEDHAITNAAARLMGVGARLTLRPFPWPVRIEVTGSYDADAGVSGYLAVTGSLAAPPLPTAVGR